MSEIVVDIEQVQSSPESKNDGESQVSDYRGRSVRADDHDDESNLSATGGCSEAIKGLACGVLAGASWGVVCSSVVWVPGIVFLAKGNDIGEIFMYTAIGVTFFTTAAYGIGGLKVGL
ncbi:MAG: hypothetical protein AAGG81_00775 [Chlamydiota bacterium]